MISVEGLRLALAARPRQVLDIPGLRRAAVLVPLVERDGETRLLFTLRSTALRSHSGQISFPGGGSDEGDADLPATATREAQEEVGIPPASVHVLGLLDDVPTPTGYVITPVVAWIDPPPVAYEANPREVAEVFEVALARLAAPGVRETLGEVDRWGTRFAIHSYKLDGRNIWGATAHMVTGLLATLGPLL